MFKMFKTIFGKSVKKRVISDKAMHEMVVTAAALYRIRQAFLEATTNETKNDITCRIYHCHQIWLYDMPRGLYEQYLDYMATRPYSNPNWEKEVDAKRKELLAV